MYSHPPTPDLNKACGNAMDAHEAAQMHQNFSQQLLQDHIEACSLPEHNLITVRHRVGRQNEGAGWLLGAGKEGPQLARTGASQGFRRAAAPVL